MFAAWENDSNAMMQIDFKRTKEIALETLILFVFLINNSLGINNDYD